MKAIFAVSALAAAISGQALAADTEATITYSGSMDTALSVDLNNDATKDVNLVDEEYSITMGIDVVNGPFSGSIGIEAEDDNGADELDSELTLTVGDITVTEGNLTFGQVGSLMSTDDYAHEMAEAGTADVTAGFKYMVAEGVTVQLQNSKAVESLLGTSYGIAAQYTGSADALSYTVEGEFSGSDAAPDGSDPQTFVGAGVTYTTDAFTVMAAVNNQGSTEKVTEYAASIEASLAGATVTAAWTDVDTAKDDDEQLNVDVAYTVSDEIGVSAGYELTTAENGDEVTAGAEYTSGMISASADVTIGNFDADEADDAKIELNVTYTAESGVEFYGDYDMQGDSLSMLTLGARYSF